MKKSDLKLGQILELRNGDIFINVGKEFLNEDSWNLPNNYLDNLKNVQFTEFDIMKVCEVSPIDGIGFTLTNKREDCLKLIWERVDVDKNTIKFLLFLRNDWVAKDADGTIFNYNSKPVKDSSGWYNISDSNYCVDNINVSKYKDLNFDFLSWDDEEPVYIPDLL